VLAAQFGGGLVSGEAGERFGDTGIDDGAVGDADVVALETWLFRQIGLVKKRGAEGGPFAFVLDGDQPQGAVGGGEGAVGAEGGMGEAESLGSFAGAKAEGRIGDCQSPFTVAHWVMALAADGRDAAGARMVAEMRAFGAGESALAWLVRDVGVPVAEGVLANGQGRHGEAMAVA
jgi:hypothetical protein